MATDEMSSALMELLHRAKIGQVDFLRESLQNVVQALMELEVTQQLHAERYEQTDERTGYRNGYRERQWDTRVGTLQLHVPRMRDGSYYPSLLEPRRRAERALVAVVQEAYIHGVSTRRVDDLVQSLGMQGISKSQVSRLCQELDEDVEHFRQRPLAGEHPYVWLDATYVKGRRQGRVVSMAVVIATSVRETGEREVVGLDVGYSEDGAFWLQFLKSLVARGLKGVQLVISDAHSGLQQAIPAVLHGASWQRCRVHWLRNVLALVPKSATQMVAATIRSIFAQLDTVTAHEQWRKVAESFRAHYPRVAALMDEAQEDVLAYASFPEEHWRQIWSTNPLERLNREVKRRSEVVGIFPNESAILRLVGTILSEQHDEWQVSRRYFSVDSMAKLLSAVSSSKESLPAPPSVS